MERLLKINNKSIDFEKIESEIEENMKKRRKQLQEYDKDIPNFQINNKITKKDELDYDCEAYTLDYNHQENITKEKKNENDYKNNNTVKETRILEDLAPYCDVRTNREISSHRPIIGPTLVKVRQVLDEETRRSIDPMIDKQTEFNKKIVCHLEFLQKRTEQLGDQLGSLNNNAEFLQKRTEQLGGQLGFLLNRRKELEKQIKHLYKSLNSIKTRKKKNGN